MYPTKFNPKDPFSLILSQDTRSAKDISTTDNVWEIQFDSGEFGGISLFSTLSLRALGIRITPIFSSQGENRINITQFSNEPEVQSLCPDYAKIHVEVFPSISMDMEYWIPNSYMICGVINMANSSNKKFEGDLQYIVNLKPVEIGQIMTGLQSDRHFFLEGRTKNLAPIFYLSGNAHAGKYGQSSIETNFQIGSDEVHKIEWCLTFLDSVDSSIAAIKIMTNHDFVKQTARIELNTQSERFLISSGNADWDKAFLASQHAATQLIILDTINDHVSLVDSLHPEKTIFLHLPPKGQLSEGITPLQLWYFSQVLPGQPKIILDNLLEFFKNQTEDGFIPNHSNPENYQYKFHAFPIFARIANLMLFQINNQELLKQIFQNLVLYLQKWLNVDQIESSPHWTNSIHSLYEDLPIHNFLNQNGNPVHTRWIQSPFLITLLLQEIEYCMLISNHISMEFPEKEWFQERKIYLLKQLNNLWDSKLKIFRYKDIQTKRSSRRYKIQSIHQSGEFKVGKLLKNSERISLKISSHKEFSRNTTVNISGFLEGKEIRESFVPRQFEWNHTIGYATSISIYDHISSIEVIQLPEGSSLDISTVDLSQIDLTNCLPVMVKDIAQKHISQIIENWIDKEFLSTYGLPFVPKNYQKGINNYQNKVDMPLNTLMMESLIESNQRELARVIFEKTIEVIIKGLRSNKKFYKLYDADDGTCTGEYNIINGMIPLKLYLNLLGIHRWTDDEIELMGTNVFPNDVTVQYQGTIITCSFDGYTITTSTGKKLDLKDRKFYKIKVQK